jgi:hypothetical protein
MVRPELNIPLLSLLGEHLPFLRGTPNIMCVFGLRTADEMEASVGSDIKELIRTFVPAHHKQVSQSRSRFSSVTSSEMWLWSGGLAIVGHEHLMHFEKHPCKVSAMQ